MSAIFDLSTGRLSIGLSHIAFGPILGIASLAAGAIGTAVSAAGTIAAGQNAEELGQFQQREYAEQAMGDVATSQRKMLEQRRNTSLVQSQLQARAAGAGLNPAVGSTDKLSGDIAGRGEYNSLMDLSAGRDAAAGLTNMGDAAKYEGDLKESMAPTAALGTIAGGASSMFMNASKNPSWFG